MFCGAAPQELLRVSQTPEELLMRTFVCAVAALAIFAGTGFTAAKAKAGASVSGTIKKVDAAGGTITVAVKDKKQTVDKDYKIADTTKVVINGTDKKELTGKDGLKNEQVKEGAVVSIMTDASGNVTMLTVGAAPKKKAQ
jgi:hypothetical protein